MTYTKKEASTPKPAPKPAPKTTYKPKVKAKPKYAAVVYRMWSPDNNCYVYTDEPKELEMNSWLQSQIDAGLIKEV